MTILPVDVPLPVPAPEAALGDVVAWEPAVLSRLGVATSAAQQWDGVSGGLADSSPSQERLSRIAAMLRDAEQATPATSRRERNDRRERRRRLRAVA
ncbi:MAG TPA: hypothetical protein VK402_13430 [Blastococcus sp.]|nr:hypothetical protein [Blastococcus sp.]